MKDKGGCEKGRKNEKGGGCKVGKKKAPVKKKKTTARMGVKPVKRKTKPMFGGMKEPVKKRARKTALDMLADVAASAKKPMKKKKLVVVPKRMKTKEEHEAIFKSYTLVRLKDIINKTNISTSGKSKQELVKSMLIRRGRFNWLEKDDKKDSYKNHKNYKMLSKEKEDEQDKRDAKANQKVRKFTGGGRSNVIAQPKARVKDAKKKAMANPIYGILKP